MSYVGDAPADKVRVKATAAFAANATLLIVGDNASAGAGPYKAPKAVAAGEVFWAENTGSGGSAGAIVSNGGTVSVVNSASADSHNGTATVSGAGLTNVRLAATTTMVDNADTIVVQNSAGSTVGGTHTATVAAGVLSNVKLAAPIAAVSNGFQLFGVTPTGTYATKVTFTVANGQIAAIVMS